MSDFFDSARSPGVIGVVLGLVVLVGFGALGMAVFDGRLNGDNATRLKEEVRAQSITIFSLEDDIERAEKKLVDQKRNEAVHQKLAVVSKTMELLEKKEKEFAPQITKLREEIKQLGEDQLAYRDEYRVYERKRAVGETFDEVALASGKVLKKAQVREILTDKVRFTTEYGSASAEWKDLPQSWRDRFQIGEGELEKHSQMMDEMRRKRGQATAAAQAQRGTQLREMELKRSLNRVTKSIASKKKEMENGRAKVAILRNKARDLRARASEARVRGSTSSHSNSAQKADSQAERLDAAVRLTRDQIADLERDKSRLEGELRRVNK